MRNHSFYHWAEMSQQEYQLNCLIIHTFFEDYISLTDWFTDFRKLTSPQNITAEVELYIEGQLNGLKTIFLIGQIENSEHQTILEDLTYELSLATRDMSMTVKDRAAFICDAWQERLQSLV